jgi:hypothetical protein
MARSAAPSRLASPSSGNFWQVFFTTVPLYVNLRFRKECSHLAPLLCSTASIARSKPGCIRSLGANTVAQFEKPPEASLPGADASTGLRIAATVLRMAFIGALALITFRVSMPQNETIWTAYDTPNDLVRLLLGLAACIWLVVQFFKGPRDAGGYRTWFYLGLVAVPFAWICLYAIW